MCSGFNITCPLAPTGNVAPVVQYGILLMMLGSGRGPVAVCRY